jgi:hypothetical protein
LKINTPKLSRGESSEVRGSNGSRSKCFFINYWGPKNILVQKLIEIESNLTILKFYSAEFKAHCHWGKGDFSVLIQAGVHIEGSDRGLPDPVSPDLPPPGRTTRAPATQQVSHQSHHRRYHGDKPDGERGERARGKEAPPPPSLPPGGPPPASSDGAEGRDMRSERVGGGVAGTARAVPHDDAGGCRMKEQLDLYH